VQRQRDSLYADLSKAESKLQSKQAEIWSLEKQNENLRRQLRNSESNEQRLLKRRQDLLQDLQDQEEIHKAEKKELQEQVEKMMQQQKQQRAEFQIKLDRQQSLHEAQLSQQRSMQQILLTSRQSTPRPSPIDPSRAMNMSLASIDDHAVMTSPNLSSMVPGETPRRVPVIQRFSECMDIQQQQARQQQLQMTPEAKTEAATCPMFKNGASTTNVLNNRSVVQDGKGESAAQKNNDIANGVSPQAPRPASVRDRVKAVEQQINSINSQRQASRDRVDSTARPSSARHSCAAGSPNPRRQVRMTQPNMTQPNLGGFEAAQLARTLQRCDRQ